MALALSRHLRRAVPLSSYLLRPIVHAPPQIRPVAPLLQTVGFKSSAHLFNYRSDYRNSEENKISPDEILFEGCDYKHWLITMDFPKDSKPTDEEMVEAYVQTCAKVLGSVEEAKRRIYACSTTTYTGFQVEVDEETSEKFKGLPGVVFVLPDSYLYPETKEYGGDKYENGTITPRPPPIQYGTHNKRRDRNRFEQTQNRPYNRNYQNTPPDQQGNFRNYPPNQPGNFQNNPPNQQGNFQNYPPQQQGNFQNYPPQQQGNYQNYPPNQQGGFQNYPPQQHGSFQNYPAPPPQRGRDGGYQRDYNVNQGQRGNFAPPDQRNFPRGPPPSFDEGFGGTMPGQHDGLKGEGVK